jgi:1-acyl-sn-glycerol-3-phosphate acyltransferase
MDAPLIFSVLERQDATGLVGDSYKRHPIIRWVVMIVDGIWIDRDGADLGALREARQMLQGGGLLGIAPEGTRSKTGALICAKTGAAYLADMAGGVPVIPIAITGTEKLFKELARLRRPSISIRFGEAFNLPPLDRRDRATTLERNTDEIMCHIATLLPPVYRGVYAEKPRLVELLADAG